MHPVILTNTGRYFNFLAPEEHEFTIDEIAHALSHLCRYTGHSRYFYSVAQHSVLVSFLVPKKLAMQALLHDAVEAYVGDVSSPLKTLLPDYKAIEKRIEHALLSQFGFPNGLDPGVKTADLKALNIERMALMPTTKADPHWAGLPAFRGWANFVARMGLKEARKAFLQRYEDLR